MNLPISRYRRAGVAVLWIAASLACLFDIAAWYPGAMPFDTAFLWWQVRGGESNDVGSAALLWLWRGLDDWLPGPGGVFAFHLVLFWSGLACLLQALHWRAVVAASAVLVVALAPVPLLLRGEVVSDTALMASLLFAAGTLARAWAGGGRAWIAAGVAALFYAVALRHNALPGALPGFFFAAWLLLRRLSYSRSLVVPVGVLLCVAAYVAAAQLARSVDRHVPVWPSLAQFDLAALSISSEKLLLPEFSVGAGFEVAELAPVFRPWSNTPMLQGTRHGLRDPLWTAWTDTELAGWRQAWYDGVRRHPQVYLAHRWRLMRALFGTSASDWPIELRYFDLEFPYRDNPPVAANTGALHRWLMARAAEARTTPLLAAWPYFGLGFIAACLATVRGSKRATGAVWGLLFSAGLYAAPLFFIAPAAELRYLAWSCLACLLAFLIAAAGCAGGRLTVRR